MLALILLMTSGCGDSADEGPNQLAAQAGDAPRLGPRSGNCQSMNAKLRWHYEQARACEVNEDCHYVDGFYTIVPRQELTRFIATSACEQPTPFLIVANAKTLAGLLPTLVPDQRFQAQACVDPQTTRSFACTAVTGFTPKGPAFCRQQVCQADRG